MKRLCLLAAVALAACVTVPQKSKPSEYREAATEIVDRRVDSPLGATYERMVAMARECRAGGGLFVDGDLYAGRASIVMGARGGSPGQYIHFIADLDVDGNQTIVRMPLLTAKLKPLALHMLGWADGTEKGCAPATSP